MMAPARLPPAHADARNERDVAAWMAGGTASQRELPFIAAGRSRVRDRVGQGRGWVR